MTILEAGPEARRELLLQRLDEIGRSLAHAVGALALLGLGSSGLDTARLDEYSDLDFFVIVQSGFKPAFLDSLSWLEAVHPIAFAFRNTDDGWKLLFNDEIFCEMAVFTPDELAEVPFEPGRIIWKVDGLEASTLQPPASRSQPPPRTVEWLLGEALTNLYVGLCRYQRGEKLSAQRFIQGYAVDRVIELAGMLAAPSVLPADAFVGERRFESRFPQVARRLPEFIQGYERSPESARAILAFLEGHFEVNLSLKNAIQARIEGLQR